MIIINQDRNMAVSFDPAGEQLLFVAPNVQDGKIQDFSLMLDSLLLGTFDSSEEAVIQQSNILECESKIYAVSGFCDYDGAKDFKKLMAHWTAQDEAELKRWCNL